jgi:hypothetical protein
LYIGSLIVGGSDGLDQHGLDKRCGAKRLSHA